MKRIFSILFFIWIAVLTQTVSAEEPAVVRVGYYENEIFQEGAEDGVIKRGYAYEYYRKLSEYTGWKYEYVYGSYNELYQKLLDGEIDFLAGLAKTDDRKGLIGYPAAAMGSETYNLIKHAADESITSDLSTLTDKRIGVLDGAMVGALDKFLKDHGVNATVVTYGDYQDLLDAFDNNVINVIAVEGSGTYGRAHAELLYTFGSTDYYLCVNIRNKELLKELNNTQRKLAAEEPFYLYMLRMKYYPAAISSKAFSSDEQEWLKHHETLKIGYLKNYLPYSDMDETGNVTGLLKDLLPSMLEAMDIQNLKIEYMAYDSYDDMIADLENRTLDVAFPVGGGIYFLEENGVSPTNAVLYSRTELIYRGMHSGDEVSSFAVNTNNRMQYYYVKANFPNAEIVEFSSTEDCLAAVLDGRVQATTLNEFRAGSILKNRRFRELSMKPLPHSEERAFGVHVGNSGLLKLLNRGLNVAGKERPEKLAYNYIENLYSYTLFDMFMDNQWLFALIVAALAALVTWFFARKSKRERERLIHVVASLADAIDAKDAYTNGHSRRVAEYSREIAKRFGYDENAQSKVYMMGLLHDVGKIGVPDAVINKTGKLTDEEFEMIKAHPGIGSRILENIREMPELSAGARWHHERYNGRGYPDGLAGKDIPEEARIIAVADAYDAMSSNRSYRNTLPQEVIRGEIEKGKGGQFDPTFADIMLAMIDEDKDYNMRDKR